MRKEQLRVKYNVKEALLQRRILGLVFFGYSSFALQQLLINTTLQLAIQYMLHWMEHFMNEAAYVIQQPEQS